MGISQQQALDCFASHDLIGIGMEADSVRRSLHPDGIVTYAVDRSFVLSGDPSALFDQIREAAAEGVVTIQLTAPQLTLDELENAITAIRKSFPSLYLQSLSANEIAEIATTASLSEEETLIRLHNAGLDAIGGDIAGLTHERWLRIHRAAHHSGLKSKASLIFGGDLHPDEFVDQLLALYNLQEETHGFASLTLHGFRPTNGRAEFEQPTAVEYLRTLAIARMVLDNFDHIESSCIAEGLKVMQMALRFGANDGGFIPSKGASSFTESDLRRVIRDAGFSPVERDALYRTMLLNN